MATENKRIRITQGSTTDWSNYSATNILRGEFVFNYTTGQLSLGVGNKTFSELAKLYIDNTNLRFGFGDSIPTTDIDFNKSGSVTFSLRDTSSTADLKIISNGANASIINNATTGDLYLGTNNTTQMAITDDGLFGFGITPTTYKLDISHTAETMLRLHRDINNNGDLLRLDFALDNSAGAVKTYAGIHSGIISNTSGSENGFLKIMSISSGNLTEVLRINDENKLLLGLSTAINGSQMEIQSTTNDQLSLIQNHTNTTNYYGLEFRTTQESGYVLGKLSFKQGTSYLEPGLKLEVSDSSKTLQTRLTIDHTGKYAFGDFAASHYIHFAQDWSGTTNTAPVAIGSLSTTGKKLLLGYNDTNDYGIIQSYQDSIGSKDLQLNPLGGTIHIGDGGFLLNKTIDIKSLSADKISIYSKDTVDNKATLALYLEQAVEEIGTFVPSHKIKIIINETAYWLQLDEV